MAKQHLEIERRWLLSGLPGPEILEALGARFLHYHTLYLCHNDPEFRLREITESSQVRYKMAVKEGEEGEERGETLIEPINGSRLFQKNLGKELPSVRKTRCKVILPINEGIRIAGEPTWQLVWELDTFFGRLHGISMAEIELPRMGFDIQIPQWLEPHILLEVTSYKAFYNKNMAANPQTTLNLVRELIAIHGTPNPR